MTHELEETLLRQARKLRKWKSAKAAAEAYGWPISTYISNENGTMPFSFEAAERYARAFKVNATALYKNKGSLIDESESVAPIDDKAIKIMGIPVVGKVAAGVFIENFEFDWQYEPQYEEYVPITISGYPQDKLFALKLEGSSINLIYPLPETRVIVCPIDYTTADHGDVVIVRREEGDKYEFTCKVLELKGNDWYVIPKSTDPDFQEPVALDGDLVQIVGVVIGAYTPQKRPIRSWNDPKRRF